MIITNYTIFEELMKTFSLVKSHLLMEYMDGHIFLYFDREKVIDCGIDVIHVDYDCVMLEYYGVMTNFRTYKLSVRNDSFHLYFNGDSLDIDDFDVQQEYFQYSTLYPFSKDFYLQIQEFRTLMQSMNLM